MPQPDGQSPLVRLPRSQQHPPAPPAAPEPPEPAEAPVGQQQAPPAPKPQDADPQLSAPAVDTKFDIDLDGGLDTAHGGTKEGSPTSPPGPCSTGAPPPPPPPVGGLPGTAPGGSPALGLWGKDVAQGPPDGASPECPAESPQRDAAAASSALLSGAPVTASLRSSCDMQVPLRGNSELRIASQVWQRRSSVTAEEDELVHCCVAAPAGPDGKLPRVTKIIMGIGESIQQIYVVIAGFYLNAYLLEVACVPVRYVGLIQLISGLWDSFNDPMIGRLSDRTRTRFGRRRPWLLGAAIPLGAVYASIWNSLDNDVSDGARFVYYLVMYMGISAGITCVQVQIGSLSPELTDDYDERTELSTYRLGIANVAGLIMAVVHGQIVVSYRSQGDVAQGYRVSGILCGCILTTNAVITFLLIRERYTPPAVQDTTLRERCVECGQGLLTVFQNRSFLLVVAMYLCGPVGVVLVQTNLLMYCKYILGNEDVVDALIPIVFGVGLSFVPLWSKAAQHFGKKTVYYCGAGMSACCIFPLLFLPKGSTIPIYPLAAGTGVGLIVPYLMPYSMLPDVIEEDEWKTHQRREGIYFGFFTIFLKLAVTGALFLTNFLLDMSGYVRPASTCGSQDGAQLADTQPEAVLDMLRLLSGPIPAVFLCAGILSAWRYPITRERHERVVALLAERHAYEEARRNAVLLILCGRKARLLPQAAEVACVHFLMNPPSAASPVSGGSLQSSPLGKRSLSLRSGC
eukprot:TRINITY_DN12181_c0_g1_i1.p1 TRINITY_DN12181_c0_g1~~TRINITY_DN12181_c0_g1_i1.p1  ORF type:complete len:780 (+),score=163.45 TRINITY_DN12181_c0_g1_i1:118-2340(+)